MEKYFSQLLFILYGLVPFLPIYGVLDITHIQYFYLSVLNLVTVLYLLKTNKDSIRIGVALKSNLIFVLVCCFSLIYTDYFLVSIREFSLYATSLVSLINLYILINKSPNNINNFKYLFLLLLISEVLAILFPFIENFSLLNPFGRSDVLNGLTYNLNIASFSILIKIPILYYFINNSKKLKSLLMIIILFLSIFTLLILSSRGAILGYLLVSFSIIAYLFLKYRFKSKSIRRLIVINISIGILAFLLQNILYQNQKSLAAVERISNLNDSSSSMRLGFYKNTLQHFKKHPIIGSGIGTWKINSIKYHQQNMTDYQVPYHAHNDFLHLLTEVGIIGIIPYLFFFWIVGYRVLKKISTSKSKQESDFLFFLLLSVLIYLIDANLNFPRVRGISQMNLMFLFSILIFILRGDNDSNFDFKNYYKILIVFSPVIIFYNFKMILNSQSQVIPYVEYNSGKLNTSSDLILEMDDTFYPINSVTVPFKNIKASYLIKDKKFNLAKQYASMGRKENPYLMMSENQLAQIYLQKGVLDSAVYFAKIAFDNLPRNLLHATTYQQVLYKIEDKEFAQKEYKRILDYYLSWKMNENMITLSENHLKSIIYFSDNETFSDEEKNISKQLLMLFPNNEQFQIFNSIIQNGLSKVGLSNQFAEKADGFFKNKEYDKAIQIWKSAIKVLPNEEAYYLNISQSYLSMNNRIQSLSFLKKIDSLGIRGKTGKYEYLFGLNLFDQKKMKKACEMLKKSSDLGYEEAYPIYRLIKCY